jgi:hypothetical protein
VHAVPEPEVGLRRFASQVEAGNLAIVRATWNHAFLEELRDFPFGRKDDQVDALSRAFTIETQIEIDYQLSQAGRGLKYSSDPTLLIKEPATTDSEIIKGAGNALVVTEKGDAKLLEIGGTASAARTGSIGWRRMPLSMGGRSGPDKDSTRRIRPLIGRARQGCAAGASHSGGRGGQDAESGPAMP